MSPDATRRRSPLEGIPLPAGMRELPFLAQVDVRIDPADTEARTRVAATVGVELPLEPNTVGGGVDGVAALWLGPDEWLLVGGAEETAGAELAGRVRAALASSLGAVVDVSANRTTVELSGPAAREVLESGCSIDLHPRAFGAGRCAQTLLARANIVLWQTTGEPSPTYRLLVRPSFAAYLAAWLTDAAEGIAEPAQGPAS